MKKSELIADLKSKEDILNVIDENPDAVAARGNVKWYDIPVIRSRGENLVQGASQPIIVIDEGLETETAYYNSQKNFTESKRAPLYTDQQYIDGVEAEFTGWNVKSLDVQIDGDVDILTVKGSDGTSYVTKRIAVWKENGTPNFKMVE